MTQSNNPMTRVPNDQMPESPLWITESDVVSLMDMPAAIRALEAGLRAEARGAAANMTKTHVEYRSTVTTEGGHSTLHAIGAACADDGFVGTKTWAHTQSGATPLLILFDSRNGSLKAIVEAFALGQLRTGAASGLATDLLATAGADELALIGTGKQSLTQVAAVAAVRPLRRVRVFGRDGTRRAQCAAGVRHTLSLEAVETTTVADAVHDAPIITCVTRAREPFLTAELVARGAHINAVGAITPGGAEVTADLLARCGQIVADSVPQARQLSSELIGYFNNAAGGWDAVRSLASLVASEQRRRSTDDLTLFKSLGMGISDVSLGIELYRRAVREGLGRAFEHPRKVAPRLRADRIRT